MRERTFSTYQQESSKTNPEDVDQNAKLTRRSVFLPFRNCLPKDHDGIHAVEQNQSSVTHWSGTRRGYIEMSGMQNICRGRDVPPISSHPTSNGVNSYQRHFVSSSSRDWASPNTYRWFGSTECSRCDLMSRRACNVAGGVAIGWEKCSIVCTYIDVCRVMLPIYLVESRCILEAVIARCLYFSGSNGATNDEDRVCSDHLTQTV